MMHVFEQMPLNITVDDKQFDVNTKHWRNKSAPYRNMTALDGISDLPKLDIGLVSSSKNTSGRVSLNFTKFNLINLKNTIK
jgi:hypothetical protein